jgi:hypothetical protein
LGGSVTDVFIHFLEKLLQGLRRFPCKILCRWSWYEPLDHGLNDNLIGHCRRLGSQSQEPSDIRLEVLFLILCCYTQLVIVEDNLKGSYDIPLYICVLTIFIIS